MDNKLNSVASDGTGVEKSTNVEAASVSPNDTKPFVGGSAILSWLKNLLSDISYRLDFWQRLPDRTLFAIVLSICLLCLSFSVSVLLFDWI